MNAHEIIRRPVVTEASMMRMAEGKYTFSVDPSANKTQIKQAIEELFKVKVMKVNTAFVRGKNRRQGIHVGRRPDWKKAIVTLREGDRIEFFEGLR